jgi:hypothetical protein
MCSSEVFKRHKIVACSQCEKMENRRAHRKKLAFFFAFPPDLPLPADFADLAEAFSASFLGG